MEIKSRSRQLAVVLTIAAATGALVPEYGCQSAKAADTDSAKAVSSAESLRSLLTQPDADARRHTVLTIGATGPLGIKAAELLIEPLHDQDVEVRACTAMILLQQDKHRDAAILVLCGLLESDEIDERCLGAFILGDAGVKDDLVREKLTDALRDTDMVMQLHAAEALLKIDPRCTPASNVLTDALTSEEAAERAFALHALGQLESAPHPTVAYKVALAIADSDKDVAASAAITLVHWSETTEILGQTDVSVDRADKIDKLLTKGSQAARRAAAVRLGVALPNSSPLQGTARKHLEDNDVVVRCSSAVALFNSPLDVRQVEQTLLNVLKSNDTGAAVVAMTAIGRMPEVSNVLLSAVEQQLSSEHATSRILAAAVIARSNPSHAKMLAQLGIELSQGNPEVRSLAARALKHAHWGQDTRIQKSLSNAAKEDNLRIRSAAGHVMSGGGSPAAVRPASHSDGSQCESSSSDDDGGAGNPADVIENEVEETSPSGAGLYSVGFETIDASRHQPNRTQRSASIKGSAQADRKLVVSRGQSPADENRAARVRVVSTANKTIQKASGVESGGPSESTFKSIRQVRASTAPTPGDVPQQPIVEEAQTMPRELHHLGVTRGFDEQVTLWTPPAVRHQPLYFQEVNLERYGYHFGCAQTAISGAVFAKNVALFPIRLVASPPCSPAYSLGYERPGNCVEVVRHRQPLLPRFDVSCEDECDDDADLYETVIPTWKVSRQK